MIAKLTLPRYLKNSIFYFCISCLFIFTTTQASASNLPSIQTRLIQLGYTAIPLHKAQRQNTFLVDASFGNGTGKNKPITLILDTGSATTYINQKIVNQYNFKQTEKYFISGGIDGHHYRTPQVIIPTVHLFNFTSHNEYAYSQRHSPLSTSGILGLDFLRKHQAIIDIYHQKLYLKLNIDQSKDVLQKILLSFGYQLVPLERSPSGQQTLMIKINHANPARFMLDTGVPPELLIDVKYAKKLGQIKNKDIATADLQYAQVGIPIVGVAGLDWMDKAHAIIDTENDRLYLKNQTGIS